MSTTFEEMVPHRRLGIKQLARDKIDRVQESFQQLNFLMRFVQIIEKKADGTPLSQTEKNFLIKAKTAWARMIAIRSASDALEIELDAMTTSFEVDRFNIHNDQKWPE